MSVKYIYRLGTRLKNLALTRPADYITGLSFYDKPFGKSYLKLSVAILEADGYIVRVDGGQLMTDVFTGDPYIEPNTGEQLEFPDGHVSVWHSNKAYWTTWYAADKANKGKSDISEQLAKFGKALVKEKES